MIAHGIGEVVEKTTDALIIDVGGIGYEIQVAAGDFEHAQLGKEAKFYTYDYLRENSHDLFGFSSLATKRLFELLISVSGVGPRMALAVLSLGDSEALRGALASADSAYIQRASGVGKRLAERITVDLKDKVGAPTTTVTGTKVTNDDALDALLALGYSLQQANEALKEIDPNLTVQAKVKLALQRGIR